MIKKLTLLALLLFLIGVIGSVVTYGSMNKEVKINDKKPIENENITSIQIDVDSTDIEFISVPRMDEARVELVGTGVENTIHDFSVKEEGETLFVSLQSENKKWFSFNFYIPALKLKIFAPEKMYNSVKIKSFSSDVLVQKLQSKTIDLETDSGDVKVENITSEKMTLKTFSGDVHMEHVQGAIETVTDSGDLYVLDAPVKSFGAVTFSGDIKLEKINGEISTKTDSGDVFISTSEISQSIHGKTFSGDIKIESEKEPEDISFEVSTFSGDVNLFDKYKNNAEIGNGTILIQLETDSGDITVINK
ncbi:DUF4097 family beta strand repeat-containing protein [Bacillus sp. REN16]|uniref:DUF4097 family beta strand repeat-containing protein n=1 Tax=Bacillus sp. REN16 TaxID=2887296 RepID=UPI001E6357E3|nr:DUF4097 family beta strand repeat-containing protein [Bacillus sp. REN16]MCC3357160.1 DUF4097 domain-containing protein [Bacillus sp. REN16]